MIIRRYLLREVLATFGGVILVILLIAISNKFVRLVSKTASGEIAPDILWQLFLFQIPDLLAFLLPIGLFLSILLSFSKSFADNEIPVMFACGIPWQRLVTVCLILGSIVMLLSGAITCYVAPHLAYHRERLLNREGPLLLIQTLSPGRFHAFSHDRFVFYMAQQSSDHSQMKKIFIAEQPETNSDSQQWTVLTAKEGEIVTEPQTQNTYIKLLQGRRYNGTPGNRDYNIIQFDEYQRLIEQVLLPEGVLFHRSAPTRSLWENPTLKNIAELQWRISVPLSALLLALLALPLSKVSPRSGRFSRIFLALLICIGYFNLLTVSKRWIATGKIMPAIGVWWVHGLLFLVAMILILIASGRWHQWTYSHGK